jgi:hypothetical protein
VLGGGAALEAFVGGNEEREAERDHDGGGELLERDGPGGVAKEELAIALADVVEIYAGDVVVLTVDHQGFLKWKDEADGGEAEDEGG